MLKSPVLKPFRMSAQVLQRCVPLCLPSRKPEPRSRRANQDKRISKAIHRDILKDFEDDWERYFALEVTWEIIRQAGDLAEKHHLRAYDSVHLASAFHLQTVVEESVSFVCFDDRLNRAAKVKGFLLV